MSDLRARALLLALFATTTTAAVGACKDGSATADAGAPVGTTSASGSASASASAKMMPSALPTVVTTDAGSNHPHGCTAIGVRGGVSETDAGVISDAMKVEGKSLTLPAGAKVTVKSVSSGKELAFLGPGSGIACRDGDEDEHWLFAGSADSTAGGPGSETWLVVPSYAVIRFAGAALHVEVGQAPTSALTLNVQGGSAWVLPIGGLPPGAADAGVTPDASGFVRVDAGRALAIPRSNAPAKAAVDRCVSAAGEARTLAGALVAPDAAIGDLAAKHVEARKRARALCTAALASLDPKDPANSKERARAEAADKSWRVVLTP
jgi:hypothetical protein